jgi:hypothetical protein
MEIAAVHGSLLRGGLDELADTLARRLHALSERRQRCESAQARRGARPGEAIRLLEHDDPRRDRNLRCAWLGVIFVGIAIIGIGNSSAFH